MKDVRPFFVPRNDLVRVSTWSRLVEDDWEDLGAFVENWDYRTRLHLRCHVACDVAAIRTSARLDDGSPIGWSLGWRATDTGLLGDPVVVPVSDEPQTVVLDIPADRAGAGLMLTRRIVLRRDRMSATPGTARWAGSILWSDETPLRLTGQGSAFPSEAVDFRAYGLDPAVSWYLELPATTDLPAMGSMLLLINSADAALVAAVTRQRRHTEVQTALVQAMEEGVVEQLVRWALVRWDQLDDVEPDSIGAAARTLATRVLPDPDGWTDPHVDQMDLTAAIIAGARRIGWGRSLA
ncbi:hypothetical protein [Pseudonocardia lacus]|uniref:hypothetical protein n=1 Tax=Pseudonocardia lacus TaxID=2835865 RepID=UPI001BDD8827|nr:hypothetical protein [Pseudonocardia lacus]